MPHRHHLKLVCRHHASRGVLWFAWGGCGGACSAPWLPNGTKPPAPAPSGVLHMHHCAHKLTSLSPSIICTSPSPSVCSPSMEHPPHASHPQLFRSTPGTSHPQVHPQLQAPLAHRIPKYTPTNCIPWKSSSCLLPLYNKVGVNEWACLVLLKGREYIRCDAIPLGNGLSVLEV